ncbi:MAG: hypothetical protein IJW21_05155 [Clostridia bacterium]|nr:hypothetical protein [Clostridia bacterium]
MDFLIEFLFELFDYIIKAITDKNAPLGAKIPLALLIGLPVVLIIIPAAVTGA